MVADAEATHPLGIKTADSSDRGGESCQNDEPEESRQEKEMPKVPSKGEDDDDDSVFDGGDDDDALFDGVSDTSSVTFPTSPPPAQRKEVSGGDGGSPLADKNAGLCSLLQDRKWDDVLVRIAARPSEAWAWRTVRQGQQKGQRGRDQQNGHARERRELPIHLACGLDPPADVILALIDAWPCGTLTVDVPDEMLPLHWACWTGASEGVVKALLDANPASVRARDKLGREPEALVEDCGSRGVYWKRSVKRMITRYDNDGHGTPTAQQRQRRWGQRQSQLPAPRGRTQSADHCLTKGSDFGIGGSSSSDHGNSFQGMTQQQQRSPNPSIWSENGPRPSFPQSPTGGDDNDASELHTKIKSLEQRLAEKTTEVHDLSDQVRRLKLENANLSRTAEKVKRQVRCLAELVDSDGADNGKGERPLSNFFGVASSGQSHPLRDPAVHPSTTKTTLPLASPKTHRQTRSSPALPSAEIFAYNTLAMAASKASAGHPFDRTLEDRYHPLRSPGASHPLPKPSHLPPVSPHSIGHRHTKTLPNFLPSTIFLDESTLDRPANASKTPSIFDVPVEVLSEHDREAGLSAFPVGVPGGNNDDDAKTPPAAPTRQRKHRVHRSCPSVPLDIYIGR